LESPTLSDLFPAHPWRLYPTDLRAKWLEGRKFTQGCVFCCKTLYYLFHTPWPLVPLKGQNLELENIRSILPFTFEVQRQNALILHGNLMKVA